MIAKASAFLLRDLRNAASYRFAFLTTLGSIAFSLVTLSLTANLVEEGRPQALAPFANDYFTFALIGSSVAFFSQAVSNSFPAAVQNAQTTGTLEVLVGTRTTLPGFLIYSSLYSIAFATVQLLAALLIGAFLLGANLRADQALLATGIVLLTMAVFAGIGVLAAAFVIRFKQREPFTGVLITASFLASGIIYPTSVLPSWIEPLTPLLPLTHSVSALRHLLLEGSSVTNVTSDFLPLIGFTLIFPLSLLIFNYAVSRAKVVGSLGQY